MRQATATALQAGDECALYLSFTAEYDSDEAFAADCQAVVQAADANGLGFYDLLLQLV